MSKPTKIHYYPHFATIYELRMTVKRLIEQKTVFFQ